MMNESKQEPKVPSMETSGKEISSHEKMMESKVPQGIKESLGFSSVSTDITDALQILLHTLETLAEPDNPARDLLTSALKVLNKALHTINEEVSSVAVQEPSGALRCEGVVTESPCDTLATKETPNVVDGVVNDESPCDAVATQGTFDVDNGLVTESSCDAVAIQGARHVESGVVTESLCDVMMSPNVQGGRVTVSPCDTLATQASAVGECTKVEGSFSNTSFRSRKRRSSYDNSMESCAHRRRNCSEIWEPPRKSRRLSESTASLCQKESSEPDEVNATDETMASYEENMTLPVETLPSLDPPEITEGEAGEETTAINESEITTSTCNVAAASEVATVEEMDSEHDATVPMKKRSYLDLRELTAGVDEDDTTVIDANEITSSSCNLTVASKLATAEEKLSGINITLPFEKCSALDVDESSEDLRTEDSTNVYERENTASSHNFITGRDLFIATDEYFEGNISLSADKVSLVDAADHTEAIVTDGTTSKDEIEITASVNDVSVAPQGFFGVDGSAEDITLPLIKVSFLDVLKPAEATATYKTVVSDESEVTSSIHGVSAASEVLIEGETPSEVYVTLPVEKLSSLDVHGLVEVVDTGETANLDEVEITACAYDGSVITVEKGLSEDINLTVEDITSPEVRQPTMAVTTDETNLDGNKIAESTGDGALAVHEHLQDKTTLPAKKVSSLDVHEPAKAVATNETTTSDDMEASLSSSTLRLRKRKRAAETASEGSGHASTSCSVHQDLGELVRKSKRCLLDSGAETPAPTPKVTFAPAVLTKGPEAAATETAVNHTIQIKAEGIPAVTSGAESPDNMGCVHYYLSTAYELLCGAMKRDPAGTLPMESDIQQSQEPTAAGSFQNNRARRRRVRRVWNGEAFVPEEQNRDHAEPHLRRRRPRRK